jgi:hypothetical protein
MLRTIILSILLSGCAAKQTTLHWHSPEQTRRCYTLFEDILSIQSQRSQISEDLLREVRDSPEEAEHLRSEWVAKEESLRAEVTALYDAGYKEGCF